MSVRYYWYVYYTDEWVNSQPDSGRNNHRITVNI